MTRSSEKLHGVRPKQRGVLDHWLASGAIGAVVLVLIAIEVAGAWS